EARSLAPRAHRAPRRSDAAGRYRRGGTVGAPQCARSDPCGGWAARGDRPGSFPDPGHAEPSRCPAHRRAAPRSVCVTRRPTVGVDLSAVARGVASRAPVERALVARALDLIVDAVGDAAEPGGRELAIAGHDLGEAGGGLVERAQRAVACELEVEPAG